MTAQPWREAAWGVPGIRAQGKELPPLPVAALVTIVLYDRDPAGISVLVPQPLEDSLGGMLLLGRLPFIFLQDPINDPEEEIQLRPRRRLTPPVSRRPAERQHLRHRSRSAPHPPRRFPPAHS